MECRTPTKTSNLSTVGKYGIYLVFVGIFVVLSFANRSFLTTNNLLNILKQASIVSVIAIGQTFCLVAGGLDLSAASVMALAGVMSAMLGRPGSPPIVVSVAVALAIGAACGLLNGLAIAKGGIPPFIATLGMQQAARGMALLVTNATPVFGLSNQYAFLGGGKLFGIPMLVIVLAIVLLICWFILSRTKFGRHIYAIGGNEHSAHVCGIRIVRTKIAVYVIAGLMAGLGGLLLAGRIRSGTPTMAEGYELDAIAGAVIGGVSTSGGVGKVYGAIVGAIMLAMISNGLDLINVPSYYQQIIKGLIIVVAVLFDVKTKRIRV
jgi:ribose/xylose/arabinose/galactoside ABC-type transport system permease subunit